MNSQVELLRLHADRQTDGQGEVIATMFVLCRKRSQYKRPISITDISTIYWLIQRSVKEQCLTVKVVCLTACV